MGHRPRVTQHAVATLVAVAVTVCCHAPRVFAGDMDGVMMQDGKMMMMKAGKPTGQMTADMTMANGTKVKTDGSITTKDGGGKAVMKDGQIMMMDGKLMSGGKATAMGR